MEEIFQRVETQVKDPTKSNIQDWLSGKGTKWEKPRTGYSSFAGDLREAFNIREEAEKEANLDDLRKLERRAERLRFEDKTTEGIVKEAIDTAEEVQREETRIEKEIQSYSDKIDALKGLPEEQLKEEYRSGNREIRLLAGIALGEENPSSLRSFKGWETRRAREAFRRIF